MGDRAGLRPPIRSVVRQAAWRGWARGRRLRRPGSAAHDEQRPVLVVEAESDDAPLFTLDGRDALGRNAAWHFAPERRGSRERPTLPPGAKRERGVRIRKPVRQRTNLAPKEPQELGPSPTRSSSG